MYVHVLFMHVYGMTYMYMYMYIVYRIHTHSQLCVCQIGREILPVGRTETPVDMLRSILAQLHFQHDVLQFEKKGVPFRSHMYVPEVHPLTGEPFHERKDEAHVFKVCYCPTRTCTCTSSMLYACVHNYYSTCTCTCKCVHVHVQTLYIHVNDCTYTCAHAKMSWWGQTSQQTVLF